MPSNPTPRRRYRSARPIKISPIGVASLLYAAIIYVLVLLGSVQLTAFLIGAALLIFFLLFFFTVFACKWNTRLRDPSMTVPQMCAAIAVMLTVFALDRSAHLALGPFLLVIFSQSTFRIKPITLGILSASCMTAYLALIFMQSPQSGDTFQRDILAWMVVTVALPLVTTMGAQVYALRQALKSTRHQLQQIEEKAIRDELTGLYNRRQLIIELDAAIEQATQHGTTFCLAIIDVDHFKTINDKQGHLVGDYVLREFARVAQESIRDSDIFGRYGGDEFMQILLDTELKGAVMHAERLRVHAHFLDLQNAMPAKSISLSIGIAQYRLGENAESLIERADAGLYRAKERGRNRVEWIDAS